MEEIILKKREFEENLVNLINESNLPAFVLKPIVKDLLEQLNILEQRQFEQAQKIKQEKNKEEKNKEE